jgi:hypothetical protein
MRLRVLLPLLAACLLSGCIAIEVGAGVAGGIGVYEYFHHHHVVSDNGLQPAAK